MNWYGPTVLLHLIALQCQWNRPRRARYNEAILLGVYQSRLSCHDAAVMVKRPALASSTALKEKSGRRISTAPALFEVFLSKGLEESLKAFN